MDRIGIHWMTLIVSIVLLVVLLGGLVIEKIKDRHFRKADGERFFRAYKTISEKKDRHSAKKWGWEKLTNSFADPANFFL